jgi:hypothetical protein
MRRTLAPLLILPLAACSTSKVSLCDARTVPPERTLPGPLLIQATGTEPLTIIRDGGTYSSAGYRVLWVDGERIAELDTSEAITVYLLPGRHMLTSGVHFLGKETMGPTFPVTVPGKTNVYRLTDVTGGMLIQPATK